MTATDTEAMSALHDLLDERQRYQAWLTTLEGRRNSTPPHVYERVQQDYASRLERVMLSLAERAGQLGGTIAGLTAKLSALRQHESDRTDERHEAELRAAVGEFTPEDWERRRIEADADLESIAAERLSLEGELEELQRIVALTRSIKPEVAGAPVHEATGVTSAPARPSSEPDPASEPAQRIEEFVAEWHPPQVQQSRDGGTTTSQGGLLDVSDLGDDIIPSAPMGGNPVGAAGADYGIANGVTGVTGGVAPTRTPPMAPAALGDSRRDTDKTLKCPECGAMNYATEWYCERCGGELSTF
jgi:hypothetical protein